MQTKGFFRRRSRPAQIDGLESGGLEDGLIRGTHRSSSKLFSGAGAGCVKRRTVLISDSSNIPTGERGWGLRASEGISRIWRSRIGI